MKYKKFVLLIAIIVVSCVNNNERFVKFDGPTMAVAKQNGLIYVADGYYNSRIVVFDNEGNYIRSFGSKGYDNGQFQNPHGLLLDYEENLWVADRDNGRIQIFDNKDNFVKEINSPKLGRPWSLANGKDNLIYSLDGGDQGKNTHAGISILSTEGKILCYIDFFGNNLGNINWGHSIAANKNGSTCYIADIELNYVCKLDKVSLNNNFAFIPDSNWIFEVKKYVTKPMSVGFCEDELYIGEDIPYSSIKVFNAITGKFEREILKGVFIKPHSIYVDKFNCLYITDVDANKVYKVNKEGKILLTIE